MRCSGPGKSGCDRDGTTRCWPTWNGLAIAALARCASVFGQTAWLGRAREAFDFVLAQMTAGHGGVEHAWRLGRVTAPGLIEDQAAMARAALALL